MSAEIAPIVMDEAEARRITEHIRYSAMAVRDGVEKLQSLVEQAQQGNAHLALGYSSWPAYIADVMGDEPLQLRSRDKRREVVSWLAGQGMSTRAIAPVVGASQKTVSRDLVEPESFDSPAPTTPTAAVPGPPAQESTADTVVGGVATVAAPGPRGGSASGSTRPAVTGLDGKSYPRPEMKAPRRRPITDQFFDAAHDLRKVTERLVRICDEDRFPQNAEKVATANRSDLLRARDALDGVLSRLPETN